MLRKILALIQGAGIPIEEVRCMGGAARSDLWLRIKADICGLPMVRMREEETSTLGCALLAATSPPVCVALGAGLQPLVAPGAGDGAGLRARHRRAALADLFHSGT